MTNALSDRTIISGIGQSAIGRRLGRDPLELTAEACLAALADAGLTVADIDGLTTYPGSSGPGRGFSGASLRDIHDALGIKPNWAAGGWNRPASSALWLMRCSQSQAVWRTMCCVGATFGRAPHKEPADGRVTER